ncbi:hypothetical protein Rhopal_001939-T1 [Rhodotorula paludigena]|uniref:Uncharacterized protein n=1 Tax=Rhodotorula paludigena TaxID=86838 RepID=A0AAV5GFH5_9BASI|nr:hypothetical protein Rhopal_001939-T1 [Rhodotorula paludigena]
MVWDGIDGDVTRTEIETALGMLRELEPLWENGQGNVLADGWLGQGMHDAGLLYEITGDIRAMDIMVQIADNIIALQNANTAGGGVRIWTGAKDSVWPTGELEPEDGKLVYAGCEQGLIVGNMVAAAVYILKSPCLWDLTPGPALDLEIDLVITQIPPEFDGPTVFNRTTTYKQRALAYIAAGDDTYRSFLWRFLDQRLNIINPPDARWDLTGDTRQAGTPMPWNRGMMIMYGYLKLAAAHETPDLWEPDTTAYYDTIAKQHITNFIDDLEHSTAVRNGVKTYDWNYSYGEDHTEEAQGVHAYFDIWGCWQTWQRNSAVFGVSNEVGTTFANTFEETISLGNGSFSGLVTGHSTTKSYMINRLYGGWGFYALWRRDWFDTLVAANTAVSFSGRTWLAIPLLWTKHALFLNDMTFWSGRFAHGYGVAVGTTGGDGTTSTTWGARSGAGALASYPAGALGITLVAAAALFADLA